MPAGGSLARLVDASAILSAEQQAHIAALHGQDTWSMDPAAASVTVTGPDGSRLVCRAHFLGTSAPGPGTWLWGWRNVNDFPAEFIALAERVRTVGEEQGVAELTAAEVPLTEDLPRRVTLAAKSITGLAAHYSGPIGGGSRAWLLIERQDLELPPPTARATADAILGATETVAIADHAEAIASWARRRGVALATEDAGGSGMRLTLPDGEVLVTFDEQHRITRVEERALTGLGPSTPLYDPPAAAPAPAPPAPPERQVEQPEPTGLDELLTAADGKQDEPESPMRRFWDFLRGPKP